MVERQVYQAHAASDSWHQYFQSEIHQEGVFTDSFLVNFFKQGRQGLVSAAGRIESEALIGT